ncbi:MAG TPA: hypothetical protein VF339_19825 [Gammaproteobacteria bacterium]
MGKIEEALAKLQARKAGAAEARARPPRAVARVHDSPVAGHAYGGKGVEIDFDALRAQGLLASERHERVLADEYRAIKRPLLKNASSGGELVPRGNVLMVASALPGEGKTFTAVNLALSIAREQDWSVILVDGDCNKPHVTRLFGASDQPGLMDLLRDRSASFESLVMPTNLQRFAILPAGARDERAAELLASSKMESLIAEISAADPRRMVVFDSPPLLLRPEAQVLGGHVGQVLMVVHANKTPHRAVLAARDRLDASKSINLLLNQVSARNGIAGYGDYYYGYQA